MMAACEHDRQILSLNYARCLDCHTEIHVAPVAEEEGPRTAYLLAPADKQVIHDALALYALRVALPSGDIGQRDRALQLLALMEGGTGA